MQKVINFLLVDDVEETRELLRSLVQKSMVGYTSKIQLHMYQAGSADQAAKMLAKHNFKLALLDIELPDDSGLNILRLIKADYPDCQVVMVSGNSSKQNVMAAIQEGVMGFVVKPFNQARVDEVVKNFMKKAKL